MKCWWAIVLGIDFGLLRAGVILFASQQPRGNAVVLLPPPAPIPIQVHVSGKLKKPGADSLCPESCVQKYVQAVGKITSQMDSSWTGPTAQLEGGVGVPKPVQIPSEAPGSSSASNAEDQLILPKPISSPAQIRSSTRISINTASQEQLETLPGINPATFEKIKEFITVNGGP